MVRRRRRRRPPCGASWALSTLFVVVILLVLPTHTVAAESKKQALVNWLKRTFEGATDVTTPTDGSDPLYSISQPNKEQVQAVAQDLSSSLNQASDSAPDDLDPRLSNAAAVLAQSQAAQEPPSIISQLNLLLDAMELPRSTLGHLSELRPKDIQLGLARIMPPKEISLSIGRVLDVDEKTKLELLYVTDSRCPLDVQCITGGKAIATINVTQSDYDMASYQVDVDLGRTVRLRQGYELTVKNISPRPAASTTTTDTNTLEGSKAEVITPKQADYVVLVSITIPAERTKPLTESIFKWINSNAFIKGYTFSERRSCFCPTTTTRPVTITVGPWSKTVEGYYNDVSPTVPVKAEAMTEYKTIGDLFMMLSQAYALNYDIIEARYDPIYGYPTSVVLEQDTQRTDGRVIYEAYALTVVP